MQIDAEYNKEQLPSLKHGVYHFMSSGMKSCNKCPEYDKCPHAKEGGSCVYISTFQENKIKEIMSLPHIKLVDEPIVRDYVKMLVISGLITQFIGREDLIVKKGAFHHLQPVMKMYFVCAGHLLRLSDRLGLNPVARYSLGLDNVAGSFDIALEAQKVHKVLKDDEVKNDNTGENTAVQE